MLGKQVWCPSDDNAWTRGEVTFSDGVNVSVYIEETNEVVSEILLSSVCEVDPTHDAPLDDIVQLNNLHEAPILYLLHRRLKEEQIYTWVGSDVLISVNPYNPVPLYGTDRCRELAEEGEAEAEGTAPHVYALARKAYRDMLQTHNNHSIVISGESGAGKTEASKRVIEFLAFASKKSRELPSPMHGGGRFYPSRSREGLPVSDRFLVSGHSSSSILPSRQAKGSPGDALSSPRASPPASPRGSPRKAPVEPKPRHKNSFDPEAISLALSSEVKESKKGGGMQWPVSGSHSGTVVARSDSCDDGLGRVNMAMLLHDESVEAQVSLSLPALEAFGNAKTIRNNNSSRFGKFVRVEYDQAGCIRGATTLHFLLERSRVVEVSKRERNFHIFYMLCDAACSDVAPELHLNTVGLQPSSCYKSLSHDGKPAPVDGKSDLDDFTNLCLTLDRLGVQKAEQRSLYAVLAAILALGNVELIPTEDGLGCSISSNGQIQVAATNLGCSDSALERAITKRTLVAGGTEIVSPLSAKDAAFGRDSLAKAMYSDLFDWLVRIVNQRSGGGSLASSHFIGVLDIFGFEILASNSFEQLCINFVNEMLQEYFNENVFDAETALLTSLGLPEIEVQVADNGPRLRLLTTLFARLDDEAKNKHADDVTFLRNVGSVAEEKTDWVGICRVDDRGATFTISHYAGSVVYNAGGFAAKNNDSLHADLIYLISQCCALQSLGGRTVDAKSARTTVSGKLRLAIGSVAKLAAAERKLRDSMSAGGRARSRSLTLAGPIELAAEEAEEPLMSILTSTIPHYVRCIKPNESKAAFGYNFGEVRAQLAYLGVLEVVRIRQQGFPMRLPYEQFLARFEPLLQFGLLPVGHKGSDGRPLSRKAFLAVVFPRSRKAEEAGSEYSTMEGIWQRPESARESSAIVLQAAEISMEGDDREAALGTTLVLLRNKMMSRLSSKQAWVHSCAILLQKSQRRLSPRRAYTSLRRAARTLQSLHRRRVWIITSLTALLRFRRRVEALRVIARALQVVSVMTSPAVLRRLRLHTSSAVALQCGARGMRARIARRWLALERRQSASILKLQRNWRVFLLFRYLKSHRLMALRINKISRGMLARKRFQRARASILLISRHARATHCRRLLNSARFAATTIARHVRGAIARKRAAARRRGVRVLQRWLKANHFRWLLYNLFAAAKRGEGAYVGGVLEKRPELWLVRSQVEGRPTLLHAASAGGALMLLQRLVVGVAQVVLDRPAALQEATLLCASHPSLRDASGAGCMHAAAEAGQSEVVEWVLSTACGVVRGSMRSYIDRRPFLELLALSDAQGCTMLHRCLAAINISPSTSCALRRRLRLACWLLQHGARMECVGGGQVAEGAFLTRVEGGEPARVVERAVRGALRESGGLGQLVLLRQLVGGVNSEMAEQWMSAVLRHTSPQSPQPRGGHEEGRAAESLREHQRAAARVWQLYAASPRPEAREGLSYVQLWLENIDTAEEGVEEGDLRYVTVEPCAEAEGSLLTGGATLRPIFSADGTPWVRSKPSLEEPLGLAVHENGEKLTYWHGWRSPALLEGWEGGLLLLRYYSWQPGKKPVVRGWTHAPLGPLSRQSGFHLQLRSPPVATRPRDLGRGNQLSTWIHGSLGLSTGGASAAANHRASDVEALPSLQQEGLHDATSSDLTGRACLSREDSS